MFEGALEIFVPRVTAESVVFRVAVDHARALRPTLQLNDDAIRDGKIADAPNLVVHDRADCVDSGLEYLANLSNQLGHGLRTPKKCSRHEATLALCGTRVLAWT